MQDRSDICGFLVQVQSPKPEEGSHAKGSRPKAAAWFDGREPHRIISDLRVALAPMP